MLLLHAGLGAIINPTGKRLAPPQIFTETVVLPNVVLTGGAAFLFPSIDGAHFSAVELQTGADAAAVLRDEHDAALLQRFANLPLVVGSRPAKSRLELVDHLEIDAGGFR